MPREKSNVQKVRKNLELAQSVLDKGDEIGDVLDHASLSESIRYSISRTHHEVMLERDGWELFMRKDGKEQGIQFF